MKLMKKKCKQWNMMKWMKKMNNERKYDRNNECVK